MLTGRRLAATDSYNMGFHTAVYPFITPGLMRLRSEDIHPCLTELPTDALYTFGGKMIGFTDCDSTLSSIGFITGQQYMGCTDLGEY